MFEIRKRLCGLCLIGEIVPEHCTTIPKIQTVINMQEWLRPTKTGTSNHSSFFHPLQFTTHSGFSIIPRSFNHCS